MVPKRHFSEESTGSGVPIRESKRQLTKFPAFFGDALKGVTLEEFVAQLKPFFEKVVREEVERAILRFPHSSLRPSPSHGEASGTRAWQLHFDCKLPSTLFTNSKLESEDGESIKILLLDSSSKSIITSGPLSSLRVEVIVLDGDFGADDQEDWSEEDFDSHIVSQREGKRPLLAGDRKITLRDGIGYVSEVSFTDNSSWIRSRRFRLGAKVLQTTPGIEIREAISEAFKVKDHRGETYKKHHPPYLGDEVWRLENISKGGVFHNRLSEHGISTVKDFLCLYVTDPSALRCVLGGKIANRIWEIITDHANKCVLDDGKLYMYNSATERVGLVLNSIHRVVGATFDGQNFQPRDTFSVFQMQAVEHLKQHAYQNLSELIPIEAPAHLGFSSLGLQDDSHSISNLDLQQGSFIEHQEFGTDESETQLSFNHMTTSPPYPFEVEDSTQFEVSMPQKFYPKLKNGLSMKNICSGPYGGGNCWPTSAHNLAADDTTYQAGTSTWLPVTTTWGQGNEFFLDPSAEEQVGILSPFSNFGIHFPQKRKSKARWCKLRAVVKWTMLRRRDVAAKRMARSMYLDF